MVFLNLCSNITKTKICTTDLRNVDNFCFRKQKKSEVYRPAGSCGLLIPVQWELCDDWLVDIAFNTVS